MSEVSYPRPGQTVYIADSDIFVSMIGGVPCTYKSFYARQEEVSGRAVAVYRNPGTGELEVRIPADCKVQQNPNTATNPSNFFTLTLITPDGSRYDRNLPVRYVKPMGE